METYHLTAFDISERITKHYSTSFYTASRLFGKDIRMAIFSIYGFVRIADEIVDSFHGYDKAQLLDRFEADYHDALKQGISTNPVLHAFALTVKKYQIPQEHVNAFIKSMRADLGKFEYQNTDEINDYIYGSADVVGLMCLRVFCHGNADLYNRLERPAQKLGSAFQKVNFVRDLQHDIDNLNRKYFPHIDKHNFDDTRKTAIILDIESDFKEAYEGLKQLPTNSRLAVSVAYWYYMALLKKIKYAPASQVVATRLRVSNPHKIALIAKAFLFYKLKMA